VAGVLPSDALARRRARAAVSRTASDIESNDVRELTRIAGLGLYVRRLGKQTVIDLARVLPMSIAELLDDWFESDALKERWARSASGT